MNLGTYALIWLIVFGLSIGWVWLRLRQARRKEASLASFSEGQAVLDSEAAPEEGISSEGAKKPGRHWLLLELVLLVAAVWLYCSNFLALGTTNRLPGNEAEVFQVLDWTLVNALSQSGRFPVWNPYLLTGLPYIADPMLHVYNPLVTLPVLLFGVHDGFMLAVFFSFLVGAFGMWFLGRRLNLVPPVRLWVVLMLAFAGQPAARFFQGQYLFVFGFAWIPWVVVGFLSIAERPRRLAMAGTALALALLFLSGNAYYAFYMLFVAGLAMLASLVILRREPPYLAFDRSRISTFLAVGLLALGLVAVQLFPTAQFWPYINKSLDLEGSHTPYQILLDYTSKDSERADAYSVLPAKEEFYAYIGPWPFLALGLLPLVSWKRKKIALLFLILLLLFVIAWVDLKAMPFYSLFVNWKVLLQFRHLLRVLILGSFALIALAGLGLNALWRELDHWRSAPAGKTFFYRLRPQLARLGLWGVGVFLLFGVVDLYQTNSPILATLKVSDEMPQVARWLREYDSSVYYVRGEPVNGWHGALMASGHRFMEAWYHFSDIRDPGFDSRRRAVEARPNYMIQPVDLPAPESPSQLVEQPVEGWAVYKLTDSLPFTFSVKDDLLDKEGEEGELTRQEVTALTPFLPGPNSVEIIATSEGGELLAVLYTFYPGWKAHVDGRPADLFPLNGYLAVKMLPGVHKYAFTFLPYPFYLGLLVSLVALCLAGYWILSDLSVDWVRTRQSLHGLPASLGALRKRWGEKLKPGWLVTQGEYQDGVLRPAEPLDLAPGVPLRLTVESSVSAEALPRAALRRWWWATLEILAALQPRFVPAAGWFAAALLVYLLVRLIGLVQFPIYFFTDEAIQTLLASDLLRDHLKVGGEFLPTYFNNVYQFNLSVSVYLQVLPTLLFGNSAFITRLVPMLVTLLAAGSAGLIARDVLRLPYWWSAPLFLSVMPAWFLHSRTAFETALMVSLYAAGLYFYLLYRSASPRYLYAALVFFALAFYSYSPGQVIVVLTGLLLLLSDMRYHWQQRAITLRGLGLLILLVLPYLRFYQAHPMAAGNHLSNLSSYWLQPILFSEKLSQFIREYLYGLSPGYWFVPNERDLARHLMKGYGNLYLGALPFVVLGLLVAVWKIVLGLLKAEWNILSSAYRAVLIALLVAPSGAALVEVSITRSLVMVIPATLLAVLGLATLLTWLEKLRPARPVYSLVVFVLLAIANFSMLSHALVDGPTWYSDYGLGGMQYGARQLFSEVEKYSDENPDKNLVVTASWANGTDILARFFLDEKVPVKLGSINDYLDRQEPLNENTVLVMSQEEYKKAIDSGKFKDIQVDRVIPYPDGQPGFLFTRLRYVDNIAKIFTAEKEARRVLQEAQVTIGGEECTVRFPMLDMGPIQNIFDGNPKSLVRTFEANPFVIEITFPQPRSIKGISFITGSTEARIVVKAYASADSQPQEFTMIHYGSISKPQGELDFGMTVQVTILRIEITDMRQSEPGNVHIWEVEFY